MTARMLEAQRRPHSPHEGGELLGRQPIVDRAGRTHAYEFLYRSPSRHEVHVDRWSPARQDRATSIVLSAVFGGAGVEAVAPASAAFVNITRSYAVGALELPPDTDRLVLEVVESVPADAHVVGGLRDLRARGYRIAIDDFAGRENQLAILPLADYVKVDVRDLARIGTSLLTQAASGGAVLIVERVEDEAMLALCVDAGITLFQGNLFEATTTLVRPGLVPRPRPS